MAEMAIEILVADTTRSSKAGKGKMRQMKTRKKIKKR